MRSVKEWVGKTPDENIPPRVRVRVFERHDGRCASCTRLITAGDPWQADHLKALINGGEHRESNLQLLCGWCHKEKTAEDVAEKSAVYQLKARHLGVKKSSRPLPGSRASAFKRRMDGTVVLRRPKQTHTAPSAQTAEREPKFP